MKKGIYRYFLNGKPTDISETFFIESSDDNSNFVRSIRESKNFKIRISVSTSLKNGKFNDCEIDYFSDQINLCAIYNFQEKNFQFWRIEQGRPHFSKKFTLPEKAVFFPLMRCFQGQAILQVAENQDFTTVIVPDIQNPNDVESLLKPIFDERIAKFLRKETITFYESESDAVEANLYRYLSKHYDENSHFWLDDDGFLIAYRFQQAEDIIWEVQLQK